MAHSDKGSSSSEPPGLVLAAVDECLQQAYRLLEQNKESLSRHRNEGTISRVRTSLEVLIKQIQKARSK